MTFWDESLSMRYITYLDFCAFSVFELFALVREGTNLTNNSKMGSNLSHNIARCISNRNTKDEKLTPVLGYWYILFQSKDMLTAD